MNTEAQLDSVLRQMESWKATSADEIKVRDRIEWLDKVTLHSLFAAGTLSDIVYRQ
jgi:hypothetical protein